MRSFRSFQSQITPSLYIIILPILDSRSVRLSSIQLQKNQLFASIPFNSNSPSSSPAFQISPPLSACSKGKGERRNNRKSTEKRRASNERSKKERKRKKEVRMKRERGVKKKRKEKKRRRKERERRERMQWLTFCTRWRGSGRRRRTFLYPVSNAILRYGGGRRRKEEERQRIATRVWLPLRRTLSYKLPANIS